jgi:hypothetical protein
MVRRSVLLRVRGASWLSNKGMKQTKSTPWLSRGVAFAAYAQRSADLAKGRVGWRMTLRTA